LRYPKQIRLCAKKDIERVFRHGRYRRLGWLHVRFLSTDRPDSRFLVSIKRKIGEAYRRNRIRRLVREAIRLNRASLRASYDVCFFMTACPPHPSLALFAPEVARLFRELSRSPGQDGGT
jgi:ribonuclease P protein component